VAARLTSVRRDLAGAGPPVCRHGDEGEERERRRDQPGRIARSGAAQELPARHEREPSDHDDAGAAPRQQVRSRMGGDADHHGQRQERRPGLE
jgi:hypothetical protein